MQLYFYKVCDFLNMIQFVRYQNIFKYFNLSRINIFKLSCDIIHTFLILLHKIYIFKNYIIEKSSYDEHNIHLHSVLLNNYIHLLLIHNDVIGSSSNIKIIELTVKQLIPHQLLYILYRVIVLSRITHYFKNY